MRKIRVLVVDDSAYSRRAITKMLESMLEVDVIGYAADGEEGIRKIIDLKPDLVTLDLEMPRMDGFTLLRIVMEYSPTAVIVISSRSEDEKVFRALELGAVDFVAKPTKGVSEEILTIREDLHRKVRGVIHLNLAGIVRREREQERAAVAACRRTSGTAPYLSVAARTESAAPRPAGRLEVVAIGASTGGPPALQRILCSLPDVFPQAVVVSQHMPAGFTRTFAERLNRLSPLEICEAADGDEVRAGRVLIAPGGHNMVFERQGSEILARIVMPGTEDRYVPSVDAMLLSCAEVYGPRTLGVVLTGMGNDGSKGVAAINRVGGQTLAEAEETAVVFGMPKEAIATGVVDKIVPLDRMSREIMQRCGLLSDVD